MLILNEQKYAEDLYCGRNNEIKSVVKKIGYVTRYLFHVLHYDNSDNYIYTVKWLNKYHNNFDENRYSNLIFDAVKKAHKKPFYIIDSINITKSELDKISSLDNIREEKMLFVLLCMAKQQAVSNGFTNGLVKYSLPSLCKTARVSVPSEEREYLLYEIIQAGFLDYPKKNDTQCLFVNFIDDNNDVVLNINEIDFQELAYVYLQWKNAGGYDRCEKCGRLFRKNKNRKYCYECSKYQPIGDQIVECIDCHKEFTVSSKDRETNRCKDCREIHLKKIKSEQNRRYYLSKSKNSVGHNLK